MVDKAIEPSEILIDRQGLPKEKVSHADRCGIGEIEIDCSAPEQINAGLMDRLLRAAGHHVGS